MSESERLVPIKEVAEHFSVGIPTVRSWVRGNKLPPGAVIKVARTYRFKISAIEEAFLASSVQVEVESEPPKKESSVGFEYGESVGEPVSIFKLYDEKPVQDI